MTSAAVRIGVGTRLVYDGEVVEIVEFQPGLTGNEVLLKGTSKQVYTRVRLKELLLSDNARLIPDSEGPSSDDESELAGVVLAQLTEVERRDVIERAAHIREVLTGFRSGSQHLALPKPKFPLVRGI